MPNTECRTPKTEFHMVNNRIVFLRRYVDFKMGLYGGVVMGVIVFFVNYYHTHEFIGPATAALKQAAYTFIFGGVIMRGSELLATRILRRRVALILACLIPSVVSIALTFAVHSLKGTPEPLYSTIPTAIFVIPSTAVWGLIRRKSAEGELAQK
jgi:hypothetical protein